MFAPLARPSLRKHVCSWLKTALMDNPWTSDYRSTTAQDSPQGSRFFLPPFRDRE